MFSNLPLTAIRAFESAARLGGFKAASEELFVTPAAVSHQVKSLENMLGKLLFERSAQGVKLTLSGEVLYSNVHSSLLDISRSLSSLKPSSESNALSVSTTPAFAALWLIPRLDKFYNKHPNIHVSVETSNDVVDLLRDASIDMAIRCGFGDYPELHTQKLMVEEFGVFSHALWKPDSDGCALKLINVRWAKPSPVSMEWGLWCSAAQQEDWLKGAIYREYNDEHFALQAAIAGHGLVLASTVLVADYVADGLLIPYRPEIKIPGAQFSAVCAPGRERLEPVKQFFAWLLEESENFRVDFQLIQSKPSPLAPNT